MYIVVTDYISGCSSPMSSPASGAQGLQARQSLLGLHSPSSKDTPCKVSVEKGEELTPYVGVVIAVLGADLIMQFLLLFVLPLIRSQYYITSTTILITTA